MGFQDMPRIVHEAASRKGGKLKIRKGLGSMSEEKRKQIASMGGKARHANKDRGTEDKGKKAGSTMGTPRLADVLGDIDDLEV